MRRALSILGITLAALTSICAASAVSGQIIGPSDPVTPGTLFELEATAVEEHCGAVYSWTAIYSEPVVLVPLWADVEQQKVGAALGRPGIAIFVLSEAWLEADAIRVATYQHTVQIGELVKPPPIDVDPDPDPDPPDPDPDPDPDTDPDPPVADLVVRSTAAAMQCDRRPGEATELATNIEEAVGLANEQTPTITFLAGNMSSRNRADGWTPDSDKGKRWKPFSDFQNAELGGYSGFPECAAAALDIAKGLRAVDTPSTSGAMKATGGGSLFEQAGDVRDDLDKLKREVGAP